MKSNNLKHTRCILSSDSNELQEGSMRSIESLTFDLPKYMKYRRKAFILSS